VKPWTKFWKEDSQPNASLDSYFEKKRHDDQKIADLDESELSQMEDLQSTGLKRMRRDHDVIPPVWRCAISLKKKLVALSELEAGQFLHDLLDLAQRYDHQDVKNSCELPYKVLEQLRRKCNQSFRG